MALASWDEKWQHLLVRGAVAVVFGLVAMLYPLSTVIALALLWGVWALVDGMVTLAVAGRPGTTVGAGGRVALALLGVLALVAGALAVFRPGLTAVALTWILGLWLIARGVLDAVVAVADRDRESRIALLLSGAVDILLGLLFALNPGRAAIGLALVLGITALVWGLVLVVGALLVRRRQRQALVTPGSRPG
jgi:uncharacterized membrane protein HdeD (DUF308 family)